MRTYMYEHLWAHRTSLPDRAVKIDIFLHLQCMYMYASDWQTDRHAQ